MRHAVFALVASIAKNEKIRWRNGIKKYTALCDETLEWNRGLSMVLNDWFCIAMHCQRKWYKSHLAALEMHQFNASVASFNQLSTQTTRRKKKLNRSQHAIRHSN